MNSSSNRNARREKICDLVVFIDGGLNSAGKLEAAALLCIMLLKLEGRQAGQYSVATRYCDRLNEETADFSFQDSWPLSAACKKLTDCFLSQSGDITAVWTVCSQIGRMEIRLGKRGVEEWPNWAECDSAVLFCSSKDYPAEILERLAWHFQRCRAYWEKDRTVSFGEFRWYSDADVEPLIKTGVAEPLPRNCSLGKCLRESFGRFEDRTALRTTTEFLSYRELDEITGYYARELSERGISKGDAVAVFTGRGPEFVIAILAIIRVGGVFVPLAPDEPEVRQKKTLQSLGSPLTLVSKRSAKRYPAAMTLDTKVRNGANSNGCPLSDFIETHAGDPACCFLTSGTTGEPKIVKLTHGNLSSFSHAATRRLSITAEDVVLQVAPPGFDVVLEDIFPALLVGGCLAFSSTAPCSGEENLIDIVARLGVTTMEVSTAFWNRWVEYLMEARPSLPLHLRQVVIGGDHVSRRALDYWANEVRLPLLNAYGVTEASCTSTVFTWHPGDGLPPSFVRGLPIGLPLSNAKLVILDKSGRLVPPLGRGEIHIGGDGVGSGYLNDPELTAQRFGKLRQRWGDEGVYFKTGDHASWNPAFGYLFEGRGDHQVKILGYRVDLREVENALLDITQVRDSMAWVRRDEAEEMATLAAAIVADNVDSRQILECLRKKLPLYMVPKELRVLREFPRLPNGKIDRVALLGHAMVPATHDECSIRSAFVRVLGHDKFEDDESFMLAGGDSLGLISLASELSGLSGKAIPLHEVYRNQTVQEASRLLRKYSNDAPG